jgi:hypothetical protein
MCSSSIEPERAIGDGGGKWRRGWEEVVQGQLYRTSAHASEEDLQEGPRRTPMAAREVPARGIGLEFQEIQKDSASMS